MGGILTGNDPKRSENDHGTTKSDPNSPERKRRVSNRARTQKRGARRRTFELQTLRLGRNGGAPKEVTPSTTARVDNNEVLRGCLGGRDLRIPNLREGEPRSLEEWRTRHSHTHSSTHSLCHSLTHSIPM